MSDAPVRHCHTMSSVHARTVEMIDHCMMRIESACHAAICAVMNSIEKSAMLAERSSETSWALEDAIAIAHDPTSSGTGHTVILFQRRVRSKRATAIAVIPNAPSKVMYQVVAGAAYGIVASDPMTKSVASRGAVSAVSGDFTV